ncbi:hypothetical protein Q3G72_000279 [Acer saccharum]|nr:hypothetical protein Q3G72_000279 [Acer saccharum]
MPAVGMVAVMGSSLLHEDPRDRSDLRVSSSTSCLHFSLVSNRLAVVMLKDPEAAFRASILFCFNPASIFYSSIYSESLYALFSIGGLNIAVICLALSGCARSNGVINAGYFCFQTMHRAYDAHFRKK